MLISKRTMQPSVSFQVQKIIAISNGKGNLRTYQVQWAPSWVSGYHLVGCESLIEEFQRQQLGNDDSFDVSGSELSYSHHEDLTKYQELSADGTMKSNDCGPMFDDATSDDGVGHESTLPSEETTFQLHDGTDPHFFEVSNPLNYRDAVPPTEASNRPGCSTSSLNPNYEWLQRNVKNIYDGGGGREFPTKCGGERPVKPPSDVFKEKNTENRGKLSSFESTFALARNRHRLQELDQPPPPPPPPLLKNKEDKQVVLSNNMLDIKQEEIELSLNTSSSNANIGTNFARTLDNTVKTTDLNSPCVATTSKNTAIFSTCSKENTLSGSVRYPSPPPATGSIPASISTPLLPGSSDTALETDTTVDRDDKMMTSPHHDVPLKTHKCDVCQKGFKNNASLKRHVKTHSSANDAFRCTICYRRFDSRATLERHELIHNRERKYVCNICHKKFSENGNLQAHIRTHTGERPYKCSYCAKMFLTSSDLKRHLRVHTGERPYECKVCQKRFKINDHLQKHARRHVEERPSMCDNL